MSRSLLILFLLTTNLVQAQHFRYRNWSVRDGLSSTVVSDMLTDRRGFIWLATSNGLNRFDGNVFDVFQNDTADEHSLPGNEIFSLYVNRQQQLWVGTGYGISRFNEEQQNFTNYFPGPAAGKSGRWFNCMREDDQGLLWLGTWFELLIFNPADGSFKRSGWAEYAAAHHGADGNNSRIVILGVAPKAATELWILTTYGLYSVHTRTRAFTYYPFAAVSDYFGCQLNFTDNDGDPWIGTYNHGLLHYDQQSGTWKQYLPPIALRGQYALASVYGARRLATDSILVLLPAGPSCFQPSSGQFRLLDANLPPGANGFYRTIHKGTTSWLCGNDGLAALAQVEPLLNTVKLFGEEGYINRVFGIAGTQDQFFVFDPHRRQLVIRNEKSSSRTILNQQGLPITAEITGLLQRDSICLLATDQHLYRYDLATNKATQLSLPPLPFPSNENTVRNMVTDGRQHYWIRLRTQGILQWNPSDNTTSFLQLPGAAAERSYSALAYDSIHQCLWIALENEGLLRVNPLNGQTDSFSLSRGGYGNKGNIYSLAVTPSGNLLAADQSEGLYEYQWDQARFVRYTVQHGLPSNNCYSLQMDIAGNAWVTTAGGLCRFNPQSKLFTRFRDTPGLSFIHSPDGKKLYSCSGPVMYRWSNTLQPPVAANPVIYIRKVAANNQPVPFNRPYIFSPAQNNLSFYIGTITNGVDEVLPVEYRLSGEDQWILLDRSNTIHFSSLPAGKYVLQLRTTGNGASLFIPFRILLPWWKEKWFLRSLVSLLLLLAVLLARRRIRSIRKTAAYRTQLAETEMMALRAQMNPHFIFNCISSIDNFIQDNDKENASAWLNKFARLIRQVLESSQSREVPFWKDWETLQLYISLEQLRADYAFEAKLNASDELLQGHYRIPPLLIQPFVENAIQHGILPRRDRKGCLQVTARLENGVLKVVVEDNGIGREKSAALKAAQALPHTSYGLQMSRKRVALFNTSKEDTIKFEDLAQTGKEQTGTRVTILLEV